MAHVTDEISELFDDPAQILAQDDWLFLRGADSQGTPTHVMCCMCLEDWVKLPERACEACIFERMRAR
jgi:hypothetical protein